MRAYLGGTLEVDTLFLSCTRSYSSPYLLPAQLAFFNHCWKAHRYSRILDMCALVSYHATCEMVAKTKRHAMNSTVVSVASKGCPLSDANALTQAQLRAFRKRKVQPARLTMQHLD